MMDGLYLPGYYKTEGLEELEIVDIPRLERFLDKNVLKGKQIGFYRIYCLFNSLEYLYRAGFKKTTIEELDIRKAYQYLLLGEFTESEAKQIFEIETTDFSILKDFFGEKETKIFTDWLNSLKTSRKKYYIAIQNVFFEILKQAK